MNEDSRNCYLNNNSNNNNIPLEKNNENMYNLTIGMKAPNFNAISTYGNCSIEDYKGKWCILFSHPSDYTPVCTTEFLSFSKYNDEFNKRNCYLIGTSIDSLNSHLSWINNIHKSTGIQIPFPIIADLDMKVSKMYNMMPQNSNLTYTFRSVYIIDPNSTIRAILTYPVTNGRCIPEILRLLDAMQTTDRTNLLTPANWIPNQPLILPSPSTYDELLERQDNSYDCNCIDWYLCFKDL